MWSGPRNISTALMRSFGNRTDTSVVDEPFYAHYLLKTGFDHPMRDEIIASQNQDWTEISNWVTGVIPNGKSVWYQKHMAQHNLDGFNLDWTTQLTNCFLVRDPREVILSYSSKFEITSAKQLGFIQQLDLFNFLKQKTDIVPIVINAKDVLTNTTEILSILCEKLKIPFLNEMLYWQKGQRDSDGIWGHHWYRNVENSTGFQDYRERTGKIPLKLMKIYHQCNHAYLEINRYKISVNSLVR